MAFPSAPFAPRSGLRGMVNAADQLAAQAGLGTLAAGGSAGDAAVAAAAVMAVTSPHLCGMGGDLLAMISAPGADPVALLAVGRAGTGADAAAMRAEGRSVMALRGDIRSVPVPGAVDGWLAIHARFGRLPLADVMAPAIELAEAGFVASIMLTLASHLVHQVPGAQELCPDGPLPLGARVRLPGVARTLRAIVEGGRDGFYRGEFGRSLLDLGAGFYSADDLDHNAADWCAPLRLRVWGHDLWTVPCPSQGYLTLASAWVAEHVGLGVDPADPLWAHLMVEASRAAGHDRPAVLYDGADGPGLLAEARLRSAAGRVRLDRAAPPDVAASAAPSNQAVPRIGEGDTTHLCAIDADGLGISLTQSNALDFGSHLVAGSTGIFLHNRGVGFSLLAGHPAELAPRRRPPHTLSPMLATRPDGSLSHLVGAMGGDAQPQILLQLLARMLRGGQDPATAVAGARLALDAPSAGPFRLWWGDDLTVQIESHGPPEWMEGLRDRGHQVQPIRAFDPTAVGCAQIITVVRDDDGRTAHYAGAADPRSPEGGTASR
ncbi:MAG TPA: gamma-glutamyltransferase [Acidimicrobiales bacterium]|nr:gamma-glutamyltransferase [Acidimicrobiales bacterium]